jgi:hypothetical protein
MLLACYGVGNRERAQALLDDALATASELNMPLLIERSEALQAETRPKPPSAGRQAQSLLTSLHAREAAGVALPAPAEASSDDTGVFYREGEYWTVAYGGKTLRLRDAKGLHYIARVLAAPGVEVHVADLVALGGRGDDEDGALARSLVQGNLGTVLDGRARAEYKQRLQELRDELEEATGAGDLGRAAGARHEIEQITQELSAAYGLGGRARTAGDPAERARKAVTNQIRRTLERIRVGNPDLGRHLDYALRTGVFCSYAPERPITWRL